jgi:hypothetical protein
MSSKAAQKRDASSRFDLLFAHDVFGKPLHSFPDHALEVLGTFDDSSMTVTAEAGQQSKGPGLMVRDGALRLLTMRVKALSQTDLPVGKSVWRVGAKARRQ